jgi:predicted transcriptional regulator
MEMNLQTLWEGAMKDIASSDEYQSKVKYLTRYARQCPKLAITALRLLTKKATTDSTEAKFIASLQTKLESNSLAAKDFAAMGEALASRNYKLTAKDDDAMDDVDELNRNFHSGMKQIGESSIDVSGGDIGKYIKFARYYPEMALDELTKLIDSSKSPNCTIEFVWKMQEKLSSFTLTDADYANIGKALASCNYTSSTKRPTSNRSTHKQTDESYLAENDGYDLFDVTDDLIAQLNSVQAMNAAKIIDEDDGTKSVVALKAARIALANLKKALNGQPGSSTIQVVADPKWTSSKDRDLEADEEAKRFGR